MTFQCNLFICGLILLIHPFGLVAADKPTATPDAPSQPSATSLQLPAGADLRPAMERWGLTPRQQGRRPTCSVFTVAVALEYALASKENHGTRLSVEFLNWAANQVTRSAKDGGFFSELWNGYANYGICAEADMPYRAQFDPAQPPNAVAITNAQARLELHLRCHWIKKWNVNTGLTDEHLASLKQTLKLGWPVCAGLRWPKQEKWEQGVLQMCAPEAVRDGHSVLLVGWQDVADQPGGGVFIFRNTGGSGKDGRMPYAYAQAYMNDALWID